MKIEIFACGFSLDNGKPTQRGACAAVLHYVDDFSRKAVRVISEPVGNSTGPQCDVKAVMLGLMTIRGDVPLWRKGLVHVFASPYVAQLMECDDNGFKITPKKNIELVRRLREKAGLFSDLTVHAGTKEQLQQPLDVSKTAANIGVASDTDTMTGVEDGERVIVA